MVAWLHTDFRGQLAEVDIYTRANATASLPYPVGGVVPMNPHSRVFQGVFAQ